MGVQFKVLFYHAIKKQNVCFRTFVLMSINEKQKLFYN